MIEQQIFSLLIEAAVPYAAQPSQLVCYVRARLICIYVYVLGWGRPAALTLCEF